MFVLGEGERRRWLGGEDRERFWVGGDRDLGLEEGVWDGIAALIKPHHGAADLASLCEWGHRSSSGGSVAHRRNP